MEITLIEDSPGDTMLVRLALSEAGLNCGLRVIEDGEQAIIFLESLSPIDLVLVDMNLPKRSGEEILTRLRSIECYAQTPVIVMTGSDAPSDRERMEKHALLTYFRKPSSLAEFMQLGSIVREALERKTPSESTSSADERTEQKRAV
jgi:CheY-like chemotaxis protein